MIAALPPKEVTAQAAGIRETPSMSTATCSSTGRRRGTPWSGGLATKTTSKPTFRPTI